MEYRIEYFINGSVQSSTNYYSVFHSSEALTDLLHTFHRGHIHGNKITIKCVQEFCPYRQEWVDRTDKALENTDTAMLSAEGKNIIFNRDAIPTSAR